MQPVLIDGGQFVPQAAIEIFNDSGVALHDPPGAHRQEAALAKASSMIRLMVCAHRPQRGLQPRHS
jgi:hypothetical protein